jgi:restriction endonuclease Mrr
VTARELADLLIKAFDRRAATDVERALSKALRDNGVPKFAADGEAFARAPEVLRELRNRPPEDLPFRFGQADDTRLIGKERPGASDTRETAFAKQTWVLAEALLDHLLTLPPDQFEVVAAAAIELAGAHEMRALCTGDEGGIDFYGRLLVRPPSSKVTPGIVYTTILPKAVLVLGQAKRYPKDQRIGRPEIQKFKGQIEECLEKYPGNPRPPAHRVPGTYYERGEPHLGVFVSTASFAETAAGSAYASGVTLVGGRQLAQFLIQNRVGVSRMGEACGFDASEFGAWLQSCNLRLVKEI